MTTEIQGVRLDEGERSAPVLPRDILTEELVFNMGPQHPATHGVLRAVLRTDGELVVTVVQEGLLRPSRSLGSTSPRPRAGVSG